MSSWLYSDIFLGLYCAGRLALFIYLPRSAFALLDGTLPLRCCAVRFSSTTTFRLPADGKAASQVTHGGEEVGIVRVVPRDDRMCGWLVGLAIEGFSGLSGSARLWTRLHVFMTTQVQRHDVAQCMTGWWSAHEDTPGTCTVSHA